MSLLRSEHRIGASAVLQRRDMITKHQFALDLIRDSTESARRLHMSCCCNGPEPFLLSQHPSRCLLASHLSPHFQRRPLMSGGNPHSDDESVLLSSTESV